MDNTNTDDMKKVKKKQPNQKELIYSLEDFREFRRMFGERERKRIEKYKTKAYRAETVDRLRRQLNASNLYVSRLHQKIESIKSKLGEILDND